MNAVHNHVSGVESFDAIVETTTRTLFERWAAGVRTARRPRVARARQCPRDSLVACLLLRSRFSVPAMLTPQTRRGELSVAQRVQINHAPAGPHAWKKNGRLSGLVRKSLSLLLISLD